jgi:outer membrane protein OmpA-like peptidoglycan-associated protein
MGPTINTPYDEDSPFIAVNNKTLYFSSNGPKSMGGFDVFVSFRDDDNIWSTPVNLGYPINSTGDDIFYTTTIDGLRGYLTSFRKDGYGEKDIYEVQNDYMGNRPISSLRGKFISFTGQELPENLSVKILCTNCELESQKEIIPRVKNNGFFAALTRCKDYTIQFYSGAEMLGSEQFVTACNNENEEIIKNNYIGEYDLVGTVSDSKTLEFLKNAKVDFINPMTKETFATFDTDKNGGFTSDYLDGKKFGDEIEFLVEVSRKGYIKQSFIVDTTLGMFKTLKLDYLLSKLDVGVHIEDVIALNPIYFDLDKSNIRPDAAVELDKIVKIMNDNPSMVIELGSHTDCRASKSYNMSLSNRRAKSSANYIKQRITNPSRIYGKGYGESQLVNDCACEGSVVSDCSDEEHQANRRTEFKIVKK